MIEIFTDGACSGNPGKGGFAYIIKYANGQETEHSQGFIHTTNNRMELLGLIEALKKIENNEPITVYSDSQYLVNAISKGWLAGWQVKNWRGSNKKLVANIDLWKKYLEIARGKNITMKWVRGHDGHTENERCDVLAVAAYNKTNLIEDVGFGKNDSLLI